MFPDKLGFTQKCLKFHESIFNGKTLNRKYLKPIKFSRKLSQHAISITEKNTDM